MVRHNLNKADQYAKPQVRRILSKATPGIDRFGHFAGLTAQSNLICDPNPA
jgi:hypothetical protein